MRDPVADLLAFIDRSPTPYHAVAESERRLAEVGFERLEETDVWDVSPGSRHTITRNEGSLIAFEVGSGAPSEAGFRVVGAHTDSPNLRVKPTPETNAFGYRQLAVEPYGGVLLHTWLDRDLSLAGRVCIEDGDTLRTLLLDFERPLLRIPSLAIHLDREAAKKGLRLNPQQHMVPIFGLEDGPPLRDLVAGELRERDLADVTGAEVHGFDLMTYDTQPSCISGIRGEFVHAPRLDNLASCHAALLALIQAGEASHEAPTRVIVFSDHEEVGSRSAQGAAGPFLHDVLLRIVDGFKGGDPQGLQRAVAQSMLISADMAHAVHPNHADRHEPNHRPRVGGGPVIKSNANQSYASDAGTAAVFRRLCARTGVDVQDFVTRSDLGCGSTIGPITAARVGIRTVDVGNPMLSMHSCREFAGSADVEPMVRVLEAFFRDVG
jgi:aspartyl aminopeptidase